MTFLVVYRLIGFALVVLKLSMFKVCEIIGILKIAFFNFPGTERVNESINSFMVETVMKELIDSMDWFLYDSGLRHERVNKIIF